MYVEWAGQNTRHKVPGGKGRKGREGKARAGHETNTLYGGQDDMTCLYMCTITDQGTRSRKNNYIYHYYCRYYIIRFTPVRWGILPIISQNKVQMRTGAEACARARITTEYVLVACTKIWSNEHGVRKEGRRGDGPVPAQR